MPPSDGKQCRSSSPKPSTLDSLVFRLLLATCRRQGRFYVRPWWGRVYSRFTARHRVVNATVHGREVILNFGYIYPITARLYPTYNAPLLELVHEVYQLKKRPIRLVDVGAAIGDTALLVEANCQGMVSEIVCLDGDSESFGYLRTNLASLPKARLIFVQLSRSESYCPALVRAPAGSASAEGIAKVMTASLDEVLQSNDIGPIDVLKIDVDGFDGEVLAGAREILEGNHPSVVFEWHPIYCQRTGNSWHEAFRSLEAAGYSRFIWFDKFGIFSHFMVGYGHASIDATAEFCLADIPADWHYDVVALHESSSLDMQALAKLAFSRKRSSQF